MKVARLARARRGMRHVGHFDVSLAAVVARVRLAGGMILMLYVVCHLSNLSLGLWSLDVMERWRPAIMAPWQVASAKTLWGMKFARS